MYRHRPYHHGIYLHEMDVDNIPVPDTDFGIAINVEYEEPWIRLHIPHYQFHLPIDGYLDTLGNPLPEWTWPIGEQGFQNYILTSLDTNEEIRAIVQVIDGYLRVLGPDNTALPAGSYIANATSVNYVKPI